MSSTPDILIVIEDGVLLGVYTQGRSITYRLIDKDEDYMDDIESTEIDDIEEWSKELKGEDEEEENEEEDGPPREFGEDEKYLQVEYDHNYYGGEYTSWGEYAYIPVSLINYFDGDIGKAFNHFTGHRISCIVGYDSYNTNEGLYRRQGDGFVPVEEEVE